MLGVPCETMGKMALGGWECDGFFGRDSAVMIFFVVVNSGVRALGTDYLALVLALALAWALALALASRCLRPTKCRGVIQWCPQPHIVTLHIGTSQSKYINQSIQSKIRFHDLPIFYFFYLALLKNPTTPPQYPTNSATLLPSFSCSAFHSLNTSLTSASPSASACTFKNTPIHACTNS